MGNLFSSKAPAKSQAQKDAETAQAEELTRLKEKETSMKAAMARRRRGRASLISNDERGVTRTLG